MKKAIVLGASGLVGNEVLNLLLKDNRYALIKSIGRSEIKKTDKKLVQIVGDLFKMEQFKDVFNGIDDVFIAIGTTKAKTPNNEMYEKIDVDIPVSAAKLAATSGAKNLCVVSSMGANANSSIFYSRLKGRMEENILNLPIQNINIVRPSLLLGDRDENRTGESISAFLMTKLDFLVPKKHKAIEGHDVAKAMIALANSAHEKTIWMNDELKELAKQNG